MQAEAAHIAQWLHAVLPNGAGLTADSRSVKKGDAFFAFPGASHDGRAFVQAAINAGASAIVLDDSASDALQALSLVKPLANRTTPSKSVHQLKHKAGAIASAFFGSPSSKLDVIAFTGTSGKTSCSTWYSELSRSLGKPCAVIGTRGAGVPDLLEPNMPSQIALKTFGLTTPEAIVLQGFFREFVDAKIVSVAIEASSIALDQGRLNGTTIQTAVFTNLSFDHLDYHGTMQAYGQAKAALFAWPSLAHVVINIDDPAAEHMLAAVQGAVKIILVSTAPIGLATQHQLGSADGEIKRLFATNIVFSGNGVSLTVDGDFGTRQAVFKIAGLFNVSNYLSVAACALLRGYSLDQVVAGLEQLTPVEGRMQTIGGDNQVLAVIDYAHKPDALEKVLEALKMQASDRGGKLWCVFGCGGNRDTSKRPKMGAIAQRLADTVVVTSDNPRQENPADIIDQIVAGMRISPSVVIEADRKDAITWAIKNAAQEDIVLVAGKGHEAYQEINGVQHPFSDIELVNTLLNNPSVPIQNEQIVKSAAC